MFTAKLPNLKLLLIIFPIILLILAAFLYFKFASSKVVTRVQLRNPLFDIRADEDEVDRLFKDTGVIDSNSQVEKVLTGETYTPEKIQLVIQDTDFAENVTALQYHEVYGIKRAFGYGVDDSSAKYVVYIYLNPEYTDTVSSENLKYTTSSAIIRAALHIKAIREELALKGDLKLAYFRETKDLVQQYGLVDVK